MTKTLDGTIGGYAVFMSPTLEVTKINKKTQNPINSRKLKTQNPKNFIKINTRIT
jgi:hypothetical protein